MEPTRMGPASPFLFFCFSKVYVRKGRDLLGMVCGRLGRLGALIEVGIERIWNTNRKLEFFFWGGGGWWIYMFHYVHPYYVHPYLGEIPNFDEHFSLVT